MRRVVVAMLFLWLAMCVAVAAGDPLAALKAADQGWSKASQANNLDQFMTFVADDIYACGPDGKWTHGKAAMHDAWAAMMKDPTFKLGWTLDTAEVSKDGRMGYTRGSFQGTIGGKPMGGQLRHLLEEGHRRQVARRG